jgi:hypothetical protein
MWAVMKAQSFADLKFMGMSVAVAPGSPAKFIPLFDTRAEAVAFDGGSDEYVRECKVGS